MMLFYDYEYLNAQLCYSVTYLVGFLPQELLGTCIYEYIHYDDISKILDLQIAIIQESKPRDTEVFTFFVQ